MAAEVPIFGGRGTRELFNSGDVEFQCKLYFKYKDVETESDKINLSEHWGKIGGLMAIVNSEENDEARRKLVNALKAALEGNVPESDNNNTLIAPAPEQDHPVQIDWAAIATAERTLTALTRAKDSIELMKKDAFINSIRIRILESEKETHLKQMRDMLTRINTLNDKIRKHEDAVKNMVKTFDEEPGAKRLRPTPVENPTPTSPLFGGFGGGFGGFGGFGANRS